MGSSLVISVNVVEVERQRKVVINSKRLLIMLF